MLRAIASFIYSNHNKRVSVLYYAIETVVQNRSDTLYIHTHAIYPRITHACSTRETLYSSRRRKNVRARGVERADDTFDDAFVGDNRIPVTFNDVYRLIRTLGVAHYRAGETRLHEDHRVIDTS